MSPPGGCTGSQHLGGRGLEPLGRAEPGVGRSFSRPCPMALLWTGPRPEGWSSSQKQLSTLVGSLVGPRAWGGTCEPVAQTVKNLPAVGETWVRSLGWEDPLEKGMATHSSILPWRTPWAEEPGGPQSVESQRVGHD